jgi:hypothetical protein
MKRRSGIKRRVIAVATALGVLAGSVPVVASPAPANVVPAVDPISNVLVVSGSSLAGVKVFKSQAAFKGATFTFDLQPCRRASVRSCSAGGRKPPPTVLDVVKAKGAGHNVLIVFAGYNEGPRTLSSGFDLVVEAARARGITRIIWVTLRVNRDYASARIDALNAQHVNVNAVLRGKIASGDFPDVVLADWDTYSTHEPAWFVKDGTHFTRYAAWAAPDYLSRKLAFLEGRACPQPRKLGEAPQNPCPDPDLRPPDVDLTALYPIGHRLTCFEVPADRHIECRPKLANSITRTLRYGMTGREVRALQVELKKRGVLSLVTRKYDRRTLEAVMTYQLRRGLPATGVAGPSTRAALGFGCKEVPALGSACPPDNAPTHFVVPTKLGNSGQLVRMLQERLKDLGLFGGKITGVFSTDTRTAVGAFQEANSLPVTGIVDAATATALGYAPVP